jgi:dTDP-4-dehydrorhamnose 3,5-epimerase
MLIHGRLPEGAIIRDLVTHRDSRGSLTEIYRSDGAGLPLPLQWNLVQTESNTLRGVHLHREHEDYLVVVSGVMRVGLHDLRDGSTTRSAAAIVDLTGSRLQAIFVPKGVLHGFYFKEPSTYVYGLTRCWTPADDLGCRWDDPALDLPWGAVDPILSDRDAAAPSLAVLRARLQSEGWQP